MKLHIINRFVSVIFIAIAIAFASIKTQFLISILLILLALVFFPQHFLKSTKKIKWMLLVLFLIFAFNTPGQYIQNFPFSFSPTYEGLQHGGLQALKITAMLAALQLFLLNLKHEKLVSGLYQLAKPMLMVGFPAERFAVRLGLTMQYVTQLQNQEHSFKSLFQALESQDLTLLKSQKTFLIENTPFKIQDWLMLMVLLMVTASLMVIKG